MRYSGGGLGQLMWRAIERTLKLQQEEIKAVDCKETGINSCSRCNIFFKFYNKL